MTDHTEGLPEPDFSYDCGRTPCYYARTLKAYGEACAKAARAKALEEAAQVCEGKYGMDSIAVAIRALSSKEAEHD